MDSTKRIFLWSGPRNISTALMYSFAQRSDTLVYDEPLYAFYLANSKAQQYHPGAKETLASMEKDGEKVIEMMMRNQPKPLVFYKNMTHHLLDLDKAFMKNSVNVLLTREPREMLPSFAKVIEHPNMLDVGYEDHIHLLNYLESIGKPPVVIDSKRLLINPKVFLQKLCKQIKIPFEENMLSWQAGSRPEDGVWAKYWYHNVHKSTGFEAYKPKATAFPEQLKPLLKRCQPYYDRLMKLSIN